MHFFFAFPWKYQKYSLSLHQDLIIHLLFYLSKFLPGLDHSPGVEFAVTEQGFTTGCYLVYSPVLNLK